MLGQDGSEFGVYGQRFNAAGARVGGEFQANTYTAGWQVQPSVGIGAGGDFVVGWQSFGQPGDMAADGQDGSRAGIYGQRFDAAGARQGGEFRVNSTTADNQFAPAVTVDSLGGCVVTWSSNLQDGDGAGVYGQRYDAAGAPDGGEFRVNTTTAGTQAHASAAPQPGGGFVVTWTSYNSAGVSQDGSGQGVFAQRFVLPTDTSTSSTTVLTDLSPEEEEQEDGTGISLQPLPF